CIAHCKSCDHTFIAACNVLYDEYRGLCPECGSSAIECSNPQGECALGPRRHQAIQGCIRTDQKEIKQLLSQNDKNIRLQAILDKMDDKKKKSFLNNRKKELSSELSDIEKLIDIYQIEIKK
ncbi:MAG: hypothetical protein KAQ68_08025, partial [Clostridiales bacterium]|nr:hypothetical protein [Clostridiales bacterium]